MVNKLPDRDEDINFFIPCCCQGHVAMNQLNAQFKSNKT